MFAKLRTAKYMKMQASASEAVVEFAGTVQRMAKGGGNDSNLLIVFYVQIMPDDFIMQLHRF